MTDPLLILLSCFQLIEFELYSDSGKYTIINPVYKQSFCISIKVLFINTKAKWMVNESGKKAFSKGGSSEEFDAFSVELW